jgi:hypothetical protein
MRQQPSARTGLPANLGPNYSKVSQPLAQRYIAAGITACAKKE